MTIPKQWRATNGLIVIWTGEPLRFRVKSESRSTTTFFVDLSMHNGVGQCDCENWRMVRSITMYKHDKDPFDLDSQCKHQKAAMELLGRMLTAEIVSELDEVKSHHYVAD